MFIRIFGYESLCTWVAVLDSKVVLTQRHGTLEEHSNNLRPIRVAAFDTVEHLSAIVIPAVIIRQRIATIERNVCSGRPLIDNISCAFCNQQWKTASVLLFELYASKTTGKCYSKSEACNNNDDANDYYCYSV